MARNYSREYELAKGKSKFIQVRVTPELYTEFQGRCDDEGLNMSVVLKACIDAYLDNSLVYENGKLRRFPF